MIVKQLTKKDFYTTYFKVSSLNKIVSLTNTEIKVLVAIITHNDQQLRPTSPYYGKGREKVLADLNIQTSAYSNALSKLSKKGLLEKLAKKGDYALSVKIKKLKEYVDSNTKLSIVNYYEIKDASDLRRSSKTSESKAA